MLKQFSCNVPLLSFLLAGLLSTTGADVAWGTSVDLGQASQYAVLGTQSVILSSSGGITGDVGIGGGNGTLEKSTVTGTVFVDPSANPDIHNQDFVVTGGIVSKSLSQAIADAVNASATLAALSPTQTLSAISSDATLTGNGGFNVIDVGSINLVKSTLTLSGGPGDFFLINVTDANSSFVFNGSQMVLSGITPAQVLLNFPGSGADLDIFKSTAVAYGTFLAPFRSITVDNPPVNGALIGQDIDIHSLGSVKFVPVQAIPLPAAVWSGLGMLCALAILSALRRRRNVAAHRVVMV